MGARATLAALGRFLEKIIAHKHFMLYGAGNAEFFGIELVWKQVLDSVFAEFCKTHKREDSYRMTCSAIAGVVIEGGTTDFETLVRRAVAEHRGQIRINRQGTVASSRDIRQYEGRIEDVAARHHSEDDLAGAVSRHVVDRVEAALSRMRPKDAELLRRRYLDNWRPTARRLARDYKTSPDAMKKRLMRAESKFSQIYRELHEIPSVDNDDAAPDAAGLSQSVG